jgi:hypothetical protein
VETIVTMMYTTSSSDEVKAALGPIRFSTPLRTRRIARLNVAFENGDTAV